MLNRRTLIGRSMLGTIVYSIKYDFILHQGSLFMDADTCCDMTACINFFKRIDPKVERIHTMAGHTGYRFDEGKWVAILRDSIPTLAQSRSSQHQA